MSQFDVDPRAIETLQSDFRASELSMKSVIDEEKEKIEAARVEIGQKVEEAIEDEDTARVAEEQTEANLESARADFDNAVVGLDSAEKALSVAESSGDDKENKDSRAQAIAAAQARVEAARQHAEQCRENVQTCERNLERAKERHKMAVEWTNKVHEDQQRFETESAAHEAAMDISYEEMAAAVREYDEKLENYKYALEKSVDALGWNGMYKSGVLSVLPPDNDDDGSGWSGPSKVYPGGAGYTTPNYPGGARLSNSPPPLKKPQHPNKVFRSLYHGR
jgi:chromosome segregation ATPase